MKEVHIHSLEETRQLAARLAQLIQGQDLILCLDGDLGAGKTTFTKAFGKALGITAVINSPTFTIMKNYTLPDGRPFYHIDAYRLEGVHQDLGFEECFDEGVCVIEWGEFIKDQIPDEYLAFSIQEGLDEERVIQMDAKGNKARKILEVLA